MVHPQNTFHRARWLSSWRFGLGGALLLLNACGPFSAPSISAVTPLPPEAAVTTATEPPPTQPATPAANQPEPPTATLRPATPTPLSVQMGEGQAAVLAAATDAVLQPTPRSRLTFTENPVPLSFDEFYDSYDLRTGLKLSDKLVSLDGKQVVLEGYMAPPLKPQLDFFVLTKVRLQYCPFCSTDADWPDDIAVVYLTQNTTAATLKPVRLTGRLEVGSAVDPETGMVSLVRIYADKLEEIQ